MHKNIADLCVMEQATHWYFCLREPKVTESMVTDWQKWLKNDPENGRAFEKIEELMSLTGKAEKVIWPESSEKLSDDYDTDIPVSEWIVQQKNTLQQQDEQADDTSEVNKSLMQLFSFSGLYLKPATSIFALLIITLIGWQITFSTMEQDVANNIDVSVHETKYAEHDNIALPDGSTITLGAKSLVSVAYSKNQRRIILKRGEAYFEVAKDSKRPFIVKSGNRSITAIGTAFNVTRYTETERVVVTVTEGIVEVAENIAPITKNRIKIPVDVQQDPLSATLTAGQQLSYDKINQTDVVNTNPEVATAWKKGSFQYVGEKLDFVIADLNRYSATPIIIADKRIDGYIFVGTVYVDRINNWLTGITNIFPIKIRKLSDGRILLMLDEDHKESR